MKRNCGFAGADGAETGREALAKQAIPRMTRPVEDICVVSVVDQLWIRE
jgi:hypothetical protein